MSWPQRFEVVRITSADGKRHYGQGSVIAPNRVLTARHVHRPEGQNRSVWVHRAGDEKPLLAEVAWEPDGCDVSLLNVSLRQTESIHPLYVLHSEGLRAEEECRVSGFMVRAADADRAFTPYHGKVRQAQGATLVFELGNEANAPHEWRGISGAAIESKTHRGIVGVLSLEESTKRLVAVPVPSFIDDTPFRKALGLQDEDDKLAKHVGDIEKKGVTKRLEQCGPHAIRQVAAGLALGEGSDAADVAHAMIHSQPAYVVALALNGAYEAVRDAADSAGCAVLHDLMMEVLPFVSDLRSLVRKAPQHFRGRWKTGLPAREGIHVEVSRGTPTVLSVVIAGIQGQSCGFGGERDPRSGGLTSLPSSVKACFPEVDAVAASRETARHLATKVLDYQADDPRLASANLDDPHWTRMLTRLNGELRARLESNTAARPPLWLAPLEAADHWGVDFAKRDSFVASVVDELRKRVPNLCTIRGSEPDQHEYTLVAHIREMYENHRKQRG